MDNTLLKALEEDTRAQSERILQDAREEASEVMEKAEKDGAAMLEDKLKAFYAELEKKKAARVNSARIHAGGLLLKVKHELMEEAIASAFERIRKLPEKEYAGLLARLFSELSSAWEKEGLGNDFTAVASGKDLGLLKEVHTGRTVSSKEIELGVALVSPDGRFRFENTVQGRIKKARAAILITLDKALFS